MSGQYLRLGVNVDHVATIRNARGGVHPDPIHAAKIAAKAGADGITAHLREDRRHIKDFDIKKLIEEINLPLNLEMAATPEMLKIALLYNPNAVCIVPEKREEKTTEGGLNIVGETNFLKPFIERLTEKGIRVSLFIDPDPKQLDAAKSVGAPVVELHTGAYCDVPFGTNKQKQMLRLIVEAAEFAEKIGLECHAGHGLNFETVSPIAKIPEISELNIGHFLIGEGIFNGLGEAIKRMKTLIGQARECQQKA